MQMIFFIIISLIAIVSLIYAYKTQSIAGYIVAIGLFLFLGLIVLNEGIEKEQSAIIHYSASGDVNSIEYNYVNVQDSSTFAVGMISFGLGFLLLALFFIFAFFKGKAGF